MSTTLYCPSSGSPGITPSIINAGWTRTSTGISRIAASTSDSTSNVNWADSFVASIHSSCLGQWIYGPLSAQTISGNCAITIYGGDATFTNIYISAAAIWIATPAGALRTTLLAKTNDPNAVNWSTITQGFNMGTLSISSGAASAGDYLILEGGLADTAFTNSEQGWIRAGGAKTHFTFSSSIALQSLVSQDAGISWVGQPQPKKKQST